MFYTIPLIAVVNRERRYGDAVGVTRNDRDNFRIMWSNGLLVSTAERREL